MQNGKIVTTTTQAYFIFEKGVLPDIIYVRFKLGRSGGTGMRETREQEASQGEPKTPELEHLFTANLMAGESIAVVCGSID